MPGPADRETDAQIDAGLSSHPWPIDPATADLKAGPIPRFAAPATKASLLIRGKLDVVRHFLGRKKINGQAKNSGRQPQRTLAGRAIFEQMPEHPAADREKIAGVTG